MLDIFPVGNWIKVIAHYNGQLNFVTHAWSRAPLYFVSRGWVVFVDPFFFQHGITELELSSAKIRELLSRFFKEKIEKTECNMFFLWCGESLYI